MEAEARFWDDVAEKYARKPIGDVSAYERKLEIIRERLKPTDVVLDIGCGTGSLALELAPFVSHVHAVDVSIEMIKIGRRKAEDQQIRNVTFHRSAVQELAHFEPANLDGVCAFNILHLVRERDVVLRQIFDLLKPGAFFVSSTPCLAESRIPFGFILPLLRRFGKAPSVEILSIEQLTSEMCDAGFVDVSTQEVGAKRMVAFVMARRPR